MKPIEVTNNYYAEYNEIPNKKDPKFKVGDNVRISKYKNIFAKGYTPNWSEEVFVINKIKNTVPWTYAISDLNGEEITGSFYEKELQKTSQKEFRIEKVLKRKRDKLYVKWNESIIIVGIIIALIIGLIKKTFYFPKPFINFGGNINVKVDLSNYATNTSLKNGTHVDTSSFALKKT